MQTTLRQAFGDLLARSLSGRRGLAVLAAVAVIIGILLLNWQLSRAIASEGFREAASTLTCRLLHLDGGYQPVSRSGLSSLRTEGFSGSGGTGAIASIVATGIDARFKPLSLLLRRLAVKTVEIETATVQLKPEMHPPQETQEQPPVAARFPAPWGLTFQEAICGATDVVWLFREREAGFRGARLVTTPRQDGFSFRASGGMLRVWPLPELPVDHAHMSVGRDRLVLHELILGPPPQGSIRVEGRAMLEMTGPVSAKVNFDSVVIGPWLPPWGRDIQATTSGELLWESPDRKLETAAASGNIRIEGAHLSKLPFLAQFAAATRQKTIENLTLSRCALSFEWKYPVLRVRNLVMESKGFLRLTGSLTVRDQALDGILECGIHEQFLELLPASSRALFTREAESHLWTTVRVSGTLKEPRDDLTPRLAETLRKAPHSPAEQPLEQIRAWLEELARGAEPPKAAGGD